jgi:hypothetical protein
MLLKRQQTSASKGAGRSPTALEKSAGHRDESRDGLLFPPERWITCTISNGIQAEFYGQNRTFIVRRSKYERFSELELFRREPL